MKKTSIPFLLAAMLLSPRAAVADPHKDESGHGKRKHSQREHKEEYWDGNCKVERKFKKDGEYKEERKCKGREYGPAPVYGRHPPAYAPAPVYVPAPEPGIVIHGTARCA